MASTLTWFQRTRYTAVAPSSVANAITAIVNAVNANATKWLVSASAATYVELKAAGSPAGDLGTARILIFGGSAPSSGALNASVTAGTTQLYACLCVDANTTGPVQNPTAGNAYTGKSRVILGEMWATSVSASSNFVNIVESDDAIHIGIGISSQQTYFCITAGRVVVDPAGTARWGVLPSGVMSSDGSFPVDHAWVVPDFPHAAGTRTAWMETDSSGTIRPFGMFMAPHANYASTATMLSDGVDAYLLPIHLARARGFSAATTSLTYGGVARQMKFGPSASCGQSIQVASVTKAIAAGPDLVTGVHPCWFSQDQ